MKPKRNYIPGPNDNCQTPWYGVEPLLPYLRKDQTIWECCDGKGYITNYLAGEGYTVIGTDITRGMDFFNPAFDFDFDVIVTNPPFSIKKNWIETCYEIGKPFALLLPIETLGTEAQFLFERNGIQVLFMHPRIDFEMPNKGFKGNGAQFPVAWFTWKLLLPDISFARLNKPTKAETIKYYDECVVERR